jgi:hypothetical protein
VELSHASFPLVTKDKLLIGRDEGERVKEEICRRLKELPPRSVLSLDFTNIQFVDVSSVDEVVIRVLARIIAGEFPDRFMVLRGVNAQHRENIELALRVARRAVILDLAWRRWTLLGYLNSALRRILAYIADKGMASARELVQELAVEPVNTASTRLVQLYEEALVAREPWREPVRGGGRQFRYYPLLRGQYIEDKNGGKGSMTEAHRLPG